MTREDPPLRIRLPRELKLKIQELAKINRRSMNAEIVERLDASIREQARIGAPGCMKQAKEADVPEGGEDNSSLAKVLEEHEDHFEAVELSVEELRKHVAELRARLDKLDPPPPH